MRECLKVVLGVIALVIGASAPTLIVETIRPGSIVPLPQAPTQEQHSTTTNEHQSVNKIALPVTIVSSPAAETETAEQKHDAEQQHAATDKELADATWKLAWFTLGLTIVTFALAGIGWWHGLHLRSGIKAAENLAEQTKRNVELVPQIERAYVTGGGQKHVVQITSTTPLISRSHSAQSVQTATLQETGNFEIHLNNHGKTPAFLDYIEYGWCDASEPPTSITFGKKIVATGSFRVGEQSRALMLVPYQFVYKNPAIYARFHYRDIWGEKHYCTWIHRIDWPEGQIGGIYLDAPTPYKECT